MVCGGGLLVIMYQHHTHTHNRVNMKYSLALCSFIIIYQNHCPDCTESGILMFQTVTALQLNGNRIGIGDNGLTERHSVFGSVRSSENANVCSLLTIFIIWAQLKHSGMSQVSFRAVSSLRSFSGLFKLYLSALLVLK